MRAPRPRLARVPLFVLRTAGPLGGPACENPGEKSGSRQRSRLKTPAGASRPHCPPPADASLRPARAPQPTRRRRLSPDADNAMPRRSATGARGTVSQQAHRRTYQLAVHRPTRPTCSPKALRQLPHDGRARPGPRPARDARPLLRPRRRHRHAGGGGRPAAPAAAAGMDARLRRGRCGARGRDGDPFPGIPSTEIPPSPPSPEIPSTAATP